MILLVAALLSSVFMAWTIGADSASPSFGPVVSSRAVGILRSTLIVGLSALLGSVFFGEGVTKTLSGGFVSGVSFGFAQAAPILLVAATLVAIGVRLHYPIPTAFTVVGATMGAGLGMGGALNVSQTTKVFSYWLLLPFVAAGMGYLISKALRKWVTKNSKSKRFIRSVLLLVGIYTAFTAGANHVGLAVGPLAGAIDLEVQWLLLIGGLGILLGAWTGAPKIIHAVARDYTELGPRRSIAALASTSLLAQLASMFGIPISFNAAILGAVIGSGMAASDANMGVMKIQKTVFSWALTFALSFVVLFFIQRLILT